MVESIWDNEFLVKILAIENRYEEIKQLVDDPSNRYYFNALIRPILNIFPEYCFKKIRKNVMNQVKKERGRSVYRDIASQLVLAQQIECYEEKAAKLIDKVYHYNSRLIALKDEMRNAGLV